MRGADPPLLKYRVDLQQIEFQKWKTYTINMFCIFHWFEAVILCGRLALMFQQLPIQKVDVFITQQHNTYTC